MADFGRARLPDDSGLTLTADVLGRFLVNALRLEAHFSKSSVPGNGVSSTNWAKVRSARRASATVASKVSGRSLGRPKMKDPST